MCFGFGPATSTVRRTRPAVDASRHSCERFSAVPKHNPSCPVCSLTDDAFAPRRLLTPLVWPRFPAAFATTRRSDFCWAIASLFFRSQSYCLRRAQQISQGKVDQNCPSSCRQYTRGYGQKSGFVAAGQLTHLVCLTALHFRSKRQTTYDFHQTSPHGPSWATPQLETWFSRSMLLSLRCRIPSVRAPGLDFHFLSDRHAWRTRRCSGLCPALRRAPL